jgi:hypothetical protein
MVCTAHSIIKHSQTSATTIHKLTSLSIVVITFRTDRHLPILSQLFQDIDNAIIRTIIKVQTSLGGANNVRGTDEDCNPWLSQVSYGR